MGVKYIVKLLESLVFAAGSGFVCTANLRELTVGNLTDVVEIRDNARGRLRIALDISYIALIQACADARRAPQGRRAASARIYRLQDAPHY